MPHSALPLCLSVYFDPLVVVGARAVNGDGVHNERILRREARRIVLVVVMRTAHVVANLVGADQRHHQRRQHVATMHLRRQPGV